MRRVLDIVLIVLTLGYLAVCVVDGFQNKALVGGLLGCVGLVMWRAHESE